MKKSSSEEKESNDIVQLLKRDYFLKTEKDLKQRIAEIEQDFVSRGLANTTICVSKQLQVHYEYINKLLEFIMESLVKDFNITSLEDCKNELFALVESEYEKLISIANSSLVNKGLAGNDNFRTFERGIGNEKDKTKEIITTRFALLEKRKEVPANTKDVAETEPVSLQQIIEVLKNLQKSKKTEKDFEAVKSALPPIAITYEILRRSEGKRGAKTADVISSLGSAARDGSGFYPALLKELASPEVIADLETWQKKAAEKTNKRDKATTASQPDSIVGDTWNIFGIPINIKKLCAKLKSHPLLLALCLLAILTCATFSVWWPIVNRLDGNSSLINQDVPVEISEISVFDEDRRTQLRPRIKKRVDDLYNEIDNEKLKPWVFINAGIPVRVTRHDGSVISCEGVLFEGAPRLVFWSDDFIPPIIESAIVKAFDQTIEECRSNGKDPKPHVYETNLILSDFIIRVYNRMASIDNKLTGKGTPKNVQRKDVTDEISKMNRCLKRQYDAAVLLASQDEHINENSRQEVKKQTEKPFYKRLWFQICSILTTLILLITAIEKYDYIKAKWFSHIDTKTPISQKKTPMGTSNPVIMSNIKPVLEVKVDFKKNLILENKGFTDLKDISIFATRYVFDENCFGKEVKIKKYNKIGGSLYNIPMLEAKIGRESFDLTQNPMIKIYDTQGGKDNYMPLVTFYCFRVVYRDSGTGTKYSDYMVTSSYKIYPSMVDNQEATASAGTIEGDFMLEIPEIIKEHQKKLFGD